MIDEKILCIIPARGGSKRFPRKNIALLAGKPLIYYSIEEANKSGMFSDIVVSTEDKEIADIADNYGAEVIVRENSLATDTARVPQVCLDVISKLEASDRRHDILCILLPTSPLRKSIHIKKAIEKFYSSDADYLMSTTEYYYSPFRALQEGPQGFLKPFFDRKYLTRDQANPNVVVHNGSIILARIGQFKKDHDYYGAKLVGYPMPREASVDINEPSDIELAEFFIKLA